MLFRSLKTRRTGGLALNHIGTPNRSRIAQLAGPEKVLNAAALKARRTRRLALLNIRMAHRKHIAQLPTVKNIVNAGPSEAGRSRQLTDVDSSSLSQTSRNSMNGLIRFTSLVTASVMPLNNIPPTWQAAQNAQSSPSDGCQPCKYAAPAIP